MRSVRVEELMVPLEEYATVDQESTVREAVLALENAQNGYHKREYKHRAILVTDGRGRIVGKLSMLDVIRSLEPRYKQMGDFGHTTAIGFGDGFVRSMIDQYGLWQQPLEDVCERAARLEVRDVMYTPEEEEFVEADASLSEAIHQLVTGHHQSLLVTREGEVVGVLRLADVFTAICNVIKACRL